MMIGNEEALSISGGGISTMSKQQLKQAGFTIIEVVLVLAIAALIFLMVFIALPALQRSQRDDARKKDVTIISSAVQSWQGNNRSSSTKWPDTAQLGKYASEKSDNTGLIVVAPTTTAANTYAVVDGTVTVYPGLKCDGDASTATGSQVKLAKGTTRQYATVTYLEAGGGSSFCLDS